MPKKLNLVEIVKNNPHIDIEKLRKSLELSDKLRKQGMSKRGYQLVPPFAGKRAQITDSLSSDLRSTRLRRR